MSTQIQDPDWTLGWRLRRSLEYGDIDIAEMAEAIDVHRTTISRWLHDEVIPRRLFLREWADRTGVRLEWLTGEDPKVSGDGPRSSVRAGERVLTDNRGYVESRRRPSRKRPVRKAGDDQKIGRPGSCGRSLRWGSAFNHSYRATFAPVCDRQLHFCSRPLDFDSLRMLRNRCRWSTDHPNGGG